MLVTTEWLAGHLADPGLVVVDLRWREDGSGREEYERRHIPGAVFLDWASDLVDHTDPVAFMLARPEAFAQAMERCGIGDRTGEVVAYTDRLGSGPFRLWWACRAYGHDVVRVLDGGLEKWRAESRAVESGTPPPARSGGRFTPRLDARPIARADDVAAAEHEPSVAVFDSRPPEQFRGEAVWFETGPVPAGRDGVARTPRGDIRAGRVPWATSVPARMLYREDFTMKAPEELRALFAEAGVRQADRAITYCGVGLSASALAFALELAGVREVSVYDASWEEWGRDPNRPVIRG